MMQKVEEPRVAQRRYAISMTIGIVLLSFAFYLYLVAETETRAVTIGADATTGMEEGLGLVAAGSFVFGIAIIAISNLFYLGWKHDYHKFMENRQ